MIVPRPHTEAVVLHDLPDGTHALTDARQGAMLVVNDMGAAVWLLMESAESIEDLVEQVTSVLDVDPHRVASDVRAFIHTLVTHGLAG